MGVDGTWWFFRVPEDEFALLRAEYNEALQGINELPDVPSLSTKPAAPPVTQGYVDSLVEWREVCERSREDLFHPPMAELLERLFLNDEYLSEERIANLVMQSRVLPTAVLFSGIGTERFAQLPGHLGHMLIPSDEIESALATTRSALDIPWNVYRNRAQCLLDYGGPEPTERLNQDLSDILNALPKALENALSSGYGLLALSGWGMP